jgi:hypothetical protein
MLTTLIRKEDQINNCGTRNGYKKHLYAKESPCESCKIANAEYSREYRKNNFDKTSASDKKSYEKYKERYRSYQRIYNSTHISEKLVQNSNRKAKIKNNGFEKYTIKQIIDLYGTQCHICNEEIDFSAPRKSGEIGWEKGFHRDHLVPVSKSGPDTLENVRPAHGKCNMEKYNKI